MRIYEPFSDICKEAVISQLSLRYRSMDFAVPQKNLILSYREIVDLQTIFMPIRAFQILHVSGCRNDPLAEALKIGYVLQGLATLHLVCSLGAEGALYVITLVFGSLTISPTNLHFSSVSEPARCCSTAR